MTGKRDDISPYAVAEDGSNDSPLPGLDFFLWKAGPNYDMPTCRNLVIKSQ